MNMLNSFNILLRKGPNGVSYLLWLFVALSTSAFAQSLDNVTDKDLQNKVIELVGEGNLTGALPAMEELMKRKEVRPFNEREGLDKLYFFSGVGRMDLYAASNDQEEIKRAILHFQNYIEQYPSGKKAGYAYVNLGDCYRVLSDWKSMIRILSDLYDSNARYQLSRLEQAGVIEKIVQGYYITRELKAGKPWFELSLNHAETDKESKSMASTALIETVLEDGTFEDLKPLLGYLAVDTPARYRVSFNAALLNGGRKFAAANKIAEASVLFYLVLTTEEIVKFYERRKEDFKDRIVELKNDPLRDPKRVVELVQEAEFEISRSEKELDRLNNPQNKFYVKSYSTELAWVKAQNFVLAKRKYEAFWAYMRLYKDFPEYEFREDINYSAFVQAIQTGYLKDAEDLGKDYLNNANYKKYRRVVATQMVELLSKNGKSQEVYKLSLEALGENVNDDYARQILVMMGSHYLRSADVISMKTEFTKLSKKYGSTKIADGIHYWLGLAYLFEGSYEKAKNEFGLIISKYTNSSYVPDAEFRRAVCYYSLDDLEEANRLLERFARNYPNIFLRTEAESFLGDIDAQWANVDEAVEHYNNVGLTADLKENPSQIDFVAHATYQAADLLKKNGRAEEALAVYKSFLANNPMYQNVPKMIYEMGLAHEEMGNPGLMLTEWLEAIVDYGHNPEATGIDSMLEIYKNKYDQYTAKIETNREILQLMVTDKAYRNRLVNDGTFRYQTFENELIDENLKNRIARDNEFRVRFINEPELLDSFVEFYKNMENTFVQETPEVSFTKAYGDAAKAEKLTLAFRLQMALDGMGALKKDELLIFGKSDLQAASPASLIWMGNKMAEYGNDEVSREAYRLALSKYPNSPFVVRALDGLAKLETSLSNFNQALIYYSRIQNEFPDTPYVAKAMMGKADILFGQRKYDRAREAYEDILRNREWRGVAFAEALYKIGNCYRSQENYAEALNYYERAYLGYVQFRQWSASSYLGAAQSLIQLSELGKARAVLQEFLDNEDYIAFYASSKDVAFVETYGEIQTLFNQL